MPFTAEQIEGAAQAMDDWLAREERLSLELMIFPFRNGAAAEFMKHGLSRRLQLIKHCMERVFKMIPMEEATPPRAAIMDATAFLQVFVINTFGAIDNMAHIWCNEADLRDGQAEMRTGGRCQARRGKPLDCTPSVRHGN